MPNWRRSAKLCAVPSYFTNARDHLTTNLRANPTPFFAHGGGAPPEATEALPLPRYPTGISHQLSREPRSLSASRLTPNSSCKAGLKMAMWSASAVLTSARAELRADHRRRLLGVRQYVVDDRRQQEKVVGTDRGVMVTACRYVASTCGGARVEGR